MRNSSFLYMFKYENVMTDSRITVMLVILGYILLFISFYSLPRSTDDSIDCCLLVQEEYDNPFTTVIPFAILKCMLSMIVMSY